MKAYCQRNPRWTHEGQIELYRTRNPTQETSMRRKPPRTIALSSFALVVVLAAAWLAQAQDAKAPYQSPSHNMRKSWCSDSTVTKLRSKARTVSCA